MTTELDVQGKIATLHHQQSLAKTQITRGTAMVVLIPVVALAMVAIALALDSVWPGVVLVLYMLAGGTFGVASIVVGVAQLRATSKQLKQLEVERLPQARLLT